MKKKTKQNVAVLSAVTLALASAAMAVTLNLGKVFAEEDERAELSVVENLDKNFYTLHSLEDKRDDMESYICQMIAYQTGESTFDISFEYNDIYSTELIWVGNVVDFTYNDKDGYAVFRRDNDAAVLMEIVLDNISPYYGKEGTYIYMSCGIYAILHDDGSVEQFTVDTMSQNGPHKVKDKDEDKSEIVPKTYYFDTGKHKVGHLISGMYDKYENEMSLKGYNNNCANVAGAIMLNYWNKKFNNNILGLEFSAGDIDNNNNMTPASAGRYMDMFYGLMNTNWIFGNGGTLPANVISGFQALIKQKGYVAYATTLTTYSEMKQHIDNNEPLFITSLDYYFINDVKTIRNTDKNVTLSYVRFHGLKKAHTFVAYGYNYYQLYDAAGNETNINFVKVANGWGYSCLFNVNHSDISLCTAIRVGARLSRC